MEDGTPSVDPEDDHSHHPNEHDGELWQESMGVHWYDPAVCVGGYQHLSVLPPKGVADGNHFISIGGEIMDRWQNLELPLPSDDLSNIVLGPLKFRSLTPLIRHQISVAREKLQIDLTLTAFRGPHWMNYQDAKNHWESFGRLNGTVTLSGKRVPLSANFFLNRSWGNRDYSRMLSYRIVTAIFDRNLIFRLFQSTRPDGYAQHGYIIDSGRQLQVVGIESEFAMASDGVNTLGAELTAWTSEGTGYRLKARVVCSDVLTQRAGFMYCMANAVFEFGGRLGTGFLSVTELKQPSPAHKLSLGLY